MAPVDTRQEVAEAKGIPLELADRLQGSTREELEADADALARLLNPPNMDDLIRRAAYGDPLSPDDVSDMDDLIRRAAGHS